MINFAAIVPHPPLLLPGVGSSADRQKVSQTLAGLELLSKKFKQAKPAHIIISSPHPDWGINVPLYFLAKDFSKDKIKAIITGLEEPVYYFDQGKKIYSDLAEEKSYALIASGDLSHCLKDDGPYGFHPDGSAFDQALIKYLKEKDIENFLKLDEQFPGAGECGLRSFCFALGILEAQRLASPIQPKWQAEILSYQGPFGVGYLVARLL